MSEKRRGAAQVNEPRRRAQSIYETLRERICLLDYPPGTVLKERDLAIEFGVSRTPLRRVLQWLESDGLTVSKQGHGTVVTDIDLESLKDIYFLRIKLAEMIGESGPLAPREDVLQALAALKEKCRAALDEPDYRTFGEINIGLHKQFQKVIRNNRLREFSDKLFYLTARIWFRLLQDVDWREEVTDLLREITEVERYFRAGDVEAAGFVHRNHLAQVVRRFEASL